MCVQKQKNEAGVSILWTRGTDNAESALFWPKAASPKVGKRIANLGLAKSKEKSNSGQAEEQSNNLRRKTRT